MLLFPFIHIFHLFNLGCCNVLISLSFPFVLSFPTIYLLTQLHLHEFLQSSPSCERPLNEMFRFMLLVFFFYSWYGRNSQNDVLLERVASFSTISHHPYRVRLWLENHPILYCWYHSQWFLIVQRPLRCHCVHKLGITYSILKISLIAIFWQDDNVLVAASDEPSSGIIVLYLAIETISASALFTRLL